MTDPDTISAARRLEEERWARKGFRLVRLDGPRKFTDAERVEYARTGIAPSTATR